MYKRQIQKLADPVRSAKIYRGLFDRNPGAGPVLAELESVLSTAGDWGQIVEVCEIAADQSSVEDGPRRELLLRASSTAYEKNSDADRAIEDLEVLLSELPFDDEVHDHLIKILQNEERWSALADLFSARVVDGTGPHCQLLYGQLLENELADVEGAIDQYESIISVVSHQDWDQALDALERLVVDENQRERITEILEPVYRQRDWWQKLVVILDARLKYVDDTDTRVAMLREVAHHHETRQGDPELALAALEQAWLEKPADPSLYAEFAAAAASGIAWDRLSQTIETAVGDSDDEFALNYLPKKAEVVEAQLKDNDEAISIWYRVLELDPSSKLALAALARLLETEARFPELCTVLTQVTEQEEDEDARVTAFRRLAVIFELEENDNEAAIAAHLSILELKPGLIKSMDALGRLYREQRDWRGLVGILADKITVAEDADERRQLRVTAAKVHSESLEEPQESIALLREVLEEFPSDKENWRSLTKILAAESMWVECVEANNSLLGLLEEPKESAALNFHSAQVLSNELLEHKTAVERLSDVLVDDPSHGDAREMLWGLARSGDTLFEAASVLERVHRESGEFDKVVTLLELRLDATLDDASERRCLYAEMAELLEHSLDDTKGAFSVWSRSVSEFPDDEELSGQLWRTAEKLSSWTELAGTLETVLPRVNSSELECSYRMRLADIYDRTLGDQSKAATHYWRVVDIGERAEEPLRALASLYERTENYEQQERALEQLANLEPEDDAQVAALYQLGQVRQFGSGNVTGAVDAYREILERNPEHTETQEVLWSILDGENAREAAEVLEPIVRDEENPERLLDLLARKLAFVSSPDLQAAIYEEAAQIAENQLDSPIRALDAAGGWVRCTPASDRALNELERLGAVVGRHPEVAARLGDLASADVDGHTRRDLLLRQGRILFAEVDDYASAKQVFETVLEEHPGDEVALSSLETILRRSGDAVALANNLEVQAASTADAHRSFLLFSEAGEIYLRNDDLNSSVSAWRKALEIDDTNELAQSALLKLYRQNGDVSALSEMLSLAISTSSDETTKMSYRLEFAQVAEAHRGSGASVEGAWQDILDVQPSHLLAVEGLVRYYVEKKDWAGVQRTLEAQVEAAESEEVRVKALLELTSVAREDLCRNEDAIRYLLQITDLVPNHAQAIGQLEKLLSAEDRWHDLVEVYEKNIAACRHAGGQTELVRSLMRTAEIWDRELGDTNAAVASLEEVIANEPAHEAALLSLAGLHEKREAWGPCQAILESMLAVQPTPSADLLHRLGSVSFHQGDFQVSRTYLLKALEVEPLHSAALKTLQALLTETKEWEDAMLIAVRRFPNSSGEKRRAVLTSIGELATNLSTDGTALSELARVVPTEDLPLSVKRLLVEKMLGDREYERVIELLGDLAEQARKGRKMSEVAEYNIKLGDAYRALGQVEEAANALQKAFRVQPSNMSVMSSLGALHVEMEDWQSARRVYRSMVLQTFTEESPVSKAFVYRQLGFVHEQLGEVSQAKNMYQRGLDLKPGDEALLEAIAKLS